MVPTLLSLFSSTPPPPPPPPPPKPPPVIAAAAQICVASPKSPAQSRLLGLEPPSPHRSADSSLSPHARSHRSLGNPSDISYGRTISRTRTIPPLLHHFHLPSSPACSRTIPTHQLYLPSPTPIHILTREMASGQLTAPTFSARLVPSFEGLKPPTLKFASVGPFKAGSLAQRSFRGLVVRAATVVAPKVGSCFVLSAYSFVSLLVG
ncbi:hypothetical protein BT93_A1316 [Corymbia citriodora subsp. variegata]|nr:hypothetical protein BT93_A1316 [Corymbia citriodora subsp. variegata]